MAVSSKTRILVWSRAAYRCSMCRQDLFMDEISTDDPSLVGDVAHMVADSLDGPRGASPLTAEQRDLYSNLLLLCKAHHKLVDDNPAEYPVERLQHIKNDHERWVRESLEGFDPDKQRAIEMYASYVQEWTERADLAHWESWSSYMLGSGQPRMHKEDDARISELRDWLFSRVWPDQFDGLHAAFENFRRVLADCQEVFREASVERGDWLITDKIYKHVQPGSDDERRLLREFEFQVALISDLTVELTRAANYLCDQIRKDLDPSFRMAEGVLVVESGPYMDMTFRKHRVAYHGDERTAIPYPGLQQFKVVRKSRDYHWGEGTSTDDPDFRLGEHELPESQ